MNQKSKFYLLLTISLIIVVSVWLFTLKINIQNGMQGDGTKSGLSFSDLKDEISDIFSKSPLTKSNQQPTINKENDEDELKNLTDKLAQEIKDLETADWQIYRNEEYGFSFKYPSYFVATLVGQSNFSAKSDKFDWLDLKVVDSSLDGFKYDNQSGQFSFQYSAALSKWIPIPSDVSEEYAPQEYNNNSLLIYWVKTGDAGGQGETAFIESLLKEFIIEVNLSRNITVEHYTNEEDFFKVLDTFKFLPDTSDWQTYTNEEFGFEFKYPKELEVVEEQNKVYLWDKDKKDDYFVNGRLLVWIEFKDSQFNSIKEWFEDTFSNRPKESIPKYSIFNAGNVSGLRFTDTISMGGCGENVVFIKNSKLYNLERSGATCDYLDEIFNQIFSTFSFLDGSASDGKFLE